MKLPGIQYGGVQSLGNPSSLIGAVGGVARAKMSATSNMVSAIKGGISAYDEYDKQQAEEAVKDNALELQKRSLDFHSNFDERDFYPSDHPYVQNTPGFEDDQRDSIPAHEIRPAAYRAHMEQAIEELSPNIHRKTYQRDWERQSEEHLVSAVGKFTIESLEMRKRAYTAKLFDQIDMSRRQGSYDQARVLADDDALTEDQRRDQNQKTDWDETTDEFEGARLSEDPELIQLKIDSLEKGELDDVLSPRERRQYRDQLEAELDSYTKRATVQDKRDKSVAIKDAKTIADRKNKGYMTDPKVTKDAMEELDRTGASGTAADDLKDSDYNMVVVNNFSKNPLSTQKTALDQLKLSENTTADEIKTLELMEKAYNHNIEAVKKDVMGHANSLGLIHKLPIVMDGTREEFFGSLLKRASDYQEVEMILGSGNGMLSPAEAIDMSTWIKNSKPGDQAMLITSIYDANPEVADQLFEQLKVDDPSAYQAAAGAFSDGRDQDASKILTGVPMIQKMTNPEGEYNSKAVEIDVRGEMGEMFGTDIKAKESAVRAAVAIAAEAQNRGEIWDEGELKVEDVVKRATRGRIEIDDSVTVAPSGTKTEGQITEWKNSINPDFIDTLTDGSGISGLTNAEFVYLLEDGKFDWHYTAPGQWELSYQNDYGVDIRLEVDDDSGRHFVLEYNEEGAMTPGVRDRIYLEEGGATDIFKSNSEMLKPEYKSR